jgi:hypothetical protein
MAEKPTQKETTEQQPNAVPADTNAKAPAETGDRELSDADLDRVSGGANSGGGSGTVRPTVRSL